METVGRLAAGVAHDFNNLLTVIEANASLMADSTELPKQLQENLDEIIDATTQGTYIVRRLLAFSRQQQLEPRPIDLNEVLENIRGLLERSMGENVTLTFDLAPSLPAVEVDPGQVEQVIMNLAMNSRQAMPEGGEITISTARVDLDESAVEDDARLSPGPHVRIVVRDNGHGMDDATAEQAFNPFFTTRAGQAGTGLGLAAVHGAMAQSGGSVTLETKEGGGTVVTLYFPATEKRPDPPRERKPRIPALGGGETILVVEDDPAVLRAVERMLARLGYSVLTATSAAEALETLRNHPAGLDLVISDLVLGDDSGLALANRIHQDRPDLDLLLISGYSGDRPGGTRVGGVEVPFLAKPFTPTALNEKIRDVLDRE